MKELSDTELKSVKGGGISVGVAAVITIGVAFLIGVIDGLVRPLKCH